MPTISLQRYAPVRGAFWCESAGRDGDGWFYGSTRRGFSRRGCAYRRVLPRGTRLARRRLLPREDGTGPGAIAVGLLFHGLLFGGGHLYLAIRGTDGSVPSNARWRYVAMLGLLLGGGAVVLSVGDRTIGPVTLETIWIPLFVLIVCSYALSEAISGYRESRSE